MEELPRNEHYARYRFVVQDDGIGMSADYQKTLFDPFTREERSGINKVQGTGLGMAITKSVIDLMGGSISVESATGKGTRFEVVLEFPIDTEADTVQRGSRFFMQGYAAFCGKNAVYRYLFSGGGNAEALHHLFQCADIHRLGQMLVHAGFLALLHILKEGVCRHGRMGMVLPSGFSPLRMRRVASRPSITGIWISIRIMS